MTVILKNLWESGILTAVAVFVIKYLTAQTKNKNINMFLGWAQQAVALAEREAMSNTAKKSNAMTYVRRRLRANRLINHFSESQIEAAIEWAVNEMKGYEPKKSRLGE